MEESDPIPVTETVISTVSSQIPDMTDDQVRQVVQAWNAVRQGDPLGTIRRCPSTGSVAHRVSIDGIHMWQVTTPDGQHYRDTVPTLAWDCILEVQP